jgi:pyrroloquinoline quinone biosynthesis protein D
MIDDLGQVPQLARGCRIQARSAEETVLLVPEGLLRMKGAGAEILGLVDGERTIAQIIAVLHSQYPPEAHDQIASEVLTFLSSLNHRSVLLLKQP